MFTGELLAPTVSVVGGEIGDITPIQVDAVKVSEVAGEVRCTPFRRGPRKRRDRSTAATVLIVAARRSSPSSARWGRLTRAQSVEVLEPETQNQEVRAGHHAPFGDHSSLSPLRCASARPATRTGRSRLRSARPTLRRCSCRTSRTWTPALSPYGPADALGPPAAQLDLGILAHVSQHRVGPGVHEDGAVPWPPRRRAARFTSAPTTSRQVSAKSWSSVRAGPVLVGAVRCRAAHIYRSIP